MVICFKLWLSFYLDGCDLKIWWYLYKNVHEDKKCSENLFQYIFSLLPFWTFSSGFSASIIMRWVNARAWQWINYFFPTLASKERRRETKRAFSILFWLHNSLARQFENGLEKYRTEQHLAYKMMLSSPIFYISNIIIVRFLFLCDLFWIILKELIFTLLNQNFKS